jgi:hypothetical protein
MGLLDQASEQLSSSTVTAKSLEHAMGVVAKTIDPQVLSVSGSRDRLIPAITHALAYYQAAAATIPGPLPVSTSRHGSDAVITTLFPSATEIVKGLGCSIAVRNSINWFVEHGHEKVHAILGIRLRPGGNTAGGNGLRFADHTFRSLGTSAADARECLCEAAFTSLINVCASDYKDSQRKWRMRQTDQRFHQEGAEGIALEGDEPPPTALGALEQLVERLYSPQQQMRVEAGADHPPVAPLNGSGNLQLPWLASTDRRTWLVCITEFPLQEALAAINQETLVHRYILI